MQTHSTAFETRAPRGSVVVDSPRGRLRLRLPRSLYPGQQAKYISLQIDDTPENRKIAEAKARQAELDIQSSNFDFSGNKYRIFNHLTAVPSSQPEKPKPVLSLAELWESYTAYKTPTSSPKTVLDTYVPLGKHFANAPQVLNQSLEIKIYLLEVTTEHMARRCLMHLSAACKWAVKNGMLDTNPFEGMYRDLAPPKYKIEEQANPFTAQERDLIIEAFQTHNAGKKGISYNYYTNFVKFLFYTGCRPSEAVGLRWKHISEDCSRITFSEAIVRAGGKALVRETTKTKKTRKLCFPKNLQELLLSIRTENYHPETLVFPNREGNPINYNDFSRRAWKTVTKLVNLNQKNGMPTTPYNCQDTFITLPKNWV
ncbi:tyrosine-type recombinase/integrase [Microseira sp. BLCC-F43]|uniref:tyrosine-type recombinase/integrase n=1 Tax=Microseira sp. BLCC-F43 TaxID=3153602 RepID=UPI0035B7F763